MSSTGTATVTTGNTTSEHSKDMGSATTTPNLIIIIAPAAGGVVLIIILIIIAVVVYRRRRRRHESTIVKPVLPKASIIDIGMETNHMNNWNQHDDEVFAGSHERIIEDDSSIVPISTSHVKSGPPGLFRAHSVGNYENVKPEDGDDDDHDYENNPVNREKYQREMALRERKLPPTPVKTLDRDQDKNKKQQEQGGGGYQPNHGLSSSSYGAKDGKRVNESGYHTMGSRGYINDKVSKSLERLNDRVVPQPPPLGASNNQSPVNRKTEPLPIPSPKSHIGGKISPAPKPHGKVHGYVNQPK